MNAPSCAYLITNRGDGLGDTLAPGGALSCAFAPVGEPFFPIQARSLFVTTLVDELVRAAGGSGAALLTLFIHGFDTTWTQIQADTQQWFQALRDPGGYTGGVLVAFDWPSGHDPLDFLGAEGRAKQTAEESFPLLVTLLTSVITGCAAQGVTITVQLLCHSMGNYLLYCGAANLGGLSIQRTALVAALLQDTTFNPALPCDTPGAGMVATCGAMSVYSTTGDDILPWAPNRWNLHMPWLQKGHELGVTGPSSYTGLDGSVIGVDCSQVANAANAATYHASQVHTSYFAIPVLLQDLALTLMGKQARYRLPITENGQGFQIPDLPSG